MYIAFHARLPRTSRAARPVTPFHTILTDLFASYANWSCHSCTFVFSSLQKPILQPTCFQPNTNCPGAGTPAAHFCLLFSLFHQGVFAKSFAIRGLRTLFKNCRGGGIILLFWNPPLSKHRSPLSYFLIIFSGGALFGVN